MADFNENSNGVFGGVQFNEQNKGIENTSYFENGASNNIWDINWQSNDNNNIWGNSQNNLNNDGCNNTVNNPNNFEPIKKEKAMTEQGLWSKIKAFLFKEIDLTAPIKVELTPYQQKVEDEINEFLHQEITFKGIVNFFKKSK